MSGSGSQKTSSPHQPYQIRKIDRTMTTSTFKRHHRGLGAKSFGLKTSFGRKDQKSAFAREEIVDDDEEDNESPEEIIPYKTEDCTPVNDGEKPLESVTPDTPESDIEISDVDSLDEDDGVPALNGQEDADQHLELKGLEQSHSLSPGERD